MGNRRELPATGRIRTLLLPAVLAMAAFAARAGAVAAVMGNVFCDQCLDGHRTLFALPLYGATVRVDCAGEDGEVTFSKEACTDLIGNFLLKFDGVPDMSGCAARVTAGPPGSVCSIAGSPARPLDLQFSLFAMEIYKVDPLFLRPAKPMAFCPSRGPPAGGHPFIKPLPPFPFIKPLPPLPFIKPLPPLPFIKPLPPFPFIKPLPPLPFIKPLPPFPFIKPLPPLPFIKPLPPLPFIKPLPPFPFIKPLPPLPFIKPLPPFPFIKPLPPLPPLPFAKPSACPHEYWVKPQYLCYWKMVSPNATVADVFGEAAGRKYGKNMRVWDGLFGRGDVYRTLLREATTALLNSYSSSLFGFDAPAVVVRLNSALRGSPRKALIQALKFKRANCGGAGKAGCLLVPCK